ncbi:MAG: cytochrome [Bdellovibrionales bacterium]|nr:cytochrome [Bdellovibrionales bacterium]
MYLQGNLQTVFDALYNLGVIDPVLEQDWTTALDEISNHYEDLTRVIESVNLHQGDVSELMRELERFDPTTLSYLAMEVAREFADFHSREELH